MKIAHRLSAVIVFAICLVAAPTTSRGLDFTETIMLERFTVLSNGLVQYDHGNLLRNGKFRVLLTDVIDPDFYASLDFFRAFSGKVLMSEDLYFAYDALNLIPRWKAAKYSFEIGFSYYVSVAVGRNDPNPTVIVQSSPAPERVLEGDLAFFSVSAEPELFLSYQWKFRNRALAGETFSSLLILDAQRENAGIYSVSMNTGGKDVTKKALLKIVQPVVITSEPKSQMLKVGKRATLRVAAKGTGPFTYRWYFNGDTIPNATKSFYTIPKVQMTNAGDYMVELDNGPSWAFSEDAHLTVTP